MVKVVIGIRSCGKPYLLFNLFRDFLRECGVEDDRIISIALDDDLNSALRNPDALSAYIRSRVTDAQRKFLH